MTSESLSPRAVALDEAFTLGLQTHPREGKVLTTRAETEGSEFVRNADPNNT